ncbi:MAG: hypothetical protein AAGD07_02015 [Planctomycetota bacterium]
MFLKQLRAAGYHGLAIRYLDRLGDYPGVDPEIRSAVELEKAQTHIDAAVVARTASQREAAFADAEAALQEFLKRGSHPRAADARAQLGRLQMVRAAQLLSGELDDEKREQARQAYQDAASTFDSIVAELKEKLTSMQGARIDETKEPERAAERDGFRFSYLQGMVNAGEARVAAAETFAEPAAGGRKLLEEALGLFTDLSEKYAKFPLGAAALYSRGRVERLLGDRKKAEESFVRMMEMVDADPLRSARIGAASGLVELALSDEKSDYEKAIKQGEEMVKALRPNERQLPETQLLRLELARAYLAKSQDETQGNKTQRKRAESDARKLLKEANQVAGVHQEETTRLLKEVGIGGAEDEVVELPTADDPNSLDDAIASARTIMQALQRQQTELDALMQQGAEKPVIAEQVQALQQKISEARRVGIVILRRGLSMLHGESDTSMIHEGRQYLTYLLHLEQAHREASVVGQFLARFAPGTERGLGAGMLALASLQQVIASEENDSEHLMAEIEQFADYLLMTWPDSPKAAGAQEIVIRLALSNDQFDRAEALLDKMPEGPQRATLQRLMGMLVWNKFLMANAEEGHSGSDQDLEKARQYLEAGLKGVNEGFADTQTLQAGLVLTKLLLRQGKSQQAVGVLDNAKYGPLKLLPKVDDPEQSLLLDLYKTELQAVVGTMTGSNANTDPLLKRASETLDKLRDTVQGPDGKKRLVGTYVALARDIRSQLETTTPDRKAKLIDAFNVFLKQIAQSTQDESTLMWVGRTMMEIGESAMQDGELKAVGQASELIEGAASVFEDLLPKSEDKLTLRFLFARCLRMLGQYSKALDQYQNVLKEKPMMLDAQKEAALTYEMWAGELAPGIASKAYATALMGGRKGPDGKNIIWGWGRISTLTQRDPKFRTIFFDARYHVALCRYLQGKKAKDDRIVKQAIRDITSVAVLYPELGGQEQRARFDALLKKIQTDAGEPANGLPPIAQPAAS